MTDDMGIIPDEELDESGLGDLDIEGGVIDDEVVVDELAVEEEAEILDEDEEVCDLEEHGHHEHHVLKRQCHDCLAEMDEDDDDEVDYYGDEDDEARYYRSTTDEEAEDF